MSGKQGAGNKIVLVGDSGVGKTCLISRFITGNFDANVNTTNGASYASKTVEFPQFKKSLVLDIWDTAGQEKYRSLTKFFYKDALMVIMVYDITRRESYDNVKNYWYKEIQENGEKNVVFGIAGNKSDLYEEEAVPEKEAREFAQSVNAIFALTSAQNNSGVNQLFDFWILISNKKSKTKKSKLKKNKLLLIKLFWIKKIMREKLMEVKRKKADFAKLK